MKNNSTGTDYTRLAEEYTSIKLQPDKEINTDIVIVGSGASGMPAGVEAVNQGLDAIIIEHNKSIGGSGIMTYGILGVDSPLQKEQGIKVNVADVVKFESETFHYSVNGVRLKELLEGSGKNIQWLIENGVGFSGVVDTYMADGQVSSYHWFSSARSGTSFIKPLQKKFEENGGKILLRTKGRRILFDENGVTGLFAENDDGEIIKINCKAVILANGGYENNKELMAARGYDTEHLDFQGVPGHDGSGLFMGLQAGGANWMERSSLIEYPTNKNLLHKSDDDYMDLWIGFEGRQLIVNEYGERFFDESAGKKMRGYPMVAIRTQYNLRTYEIYSRDILDAAIAHVKRNAPNYYEYSKNIIDKSLEAGSKGLYKANTLEELAKKAGIDCEKLIVTIENYNSFCKKGKDGEFGKDRAYLWPIEPPYYCMEYTDTSYITAFGGLHTGRDGQLLDEKHKVVPGVYAVGTLGAELWPGFYSIGIPGAANANNVDSGRRAAKHAVKHIFGKDIKNE